MPLCENLKKDEFHEILSMLEMDFGTGLEYKYDKVPTMLPLRDLDLALCSEHSDDSLLDLKAPRHSKLPSQHENHGSRICLSHVKQNQVSKSARLSSSCTNHNPDRNLAAMDQ